MSHLNLEALARMVDEAPTALEAAHLAACEACRNELQQLHVQTSQLGGLPPLEPPALEWERVERQLQAEGLVRSVRPHRAWLGTGLRAAAAVALLVTGAALGRGLAPRVAESGGSLAAGPQDVPAEVPVLMVDEPREQPRVERAQPEPAPASPLRLASAEVAPREPRSTEEALEQLRSAELAYLDALTRFAEFSGNTAAGDPAARLAALEGIVLTTRAALGQAPTDPVINGYHLTALAQRDATLRQIASTSNEGWF